MEIKADEKFVQVLCYFYIFIGHEMIHLYLTEGNKFAQACQLKIRVESHFIGIKIFIFDLA